MVIKNPTITDIQVRDYITFKISVDKVQEAYKDNIFHSIRTCNEIDDTNWGRNPYRYEVREVNTSNNTIIVYGWTKTPNEYYDSSVSSWSFQGQKFIQAELRISLNDIDTLYSQKCSDPYLNKVYLNMTELLYNKSSKLAELLTEKYNEIPVGRYDSDYDPCNLTDYIKCGAEYSDYSGLCDTVESFRERFFRFGVDNELIWDPVKISDADIANDAKEYLDYIVSSCTKNFRILSNEIETDYLELGQSDWNDETNINADNRKFILNAVTKFYEWMMSFITPLVGTNINEAHNAEIDKLIEQAESKLKSCELQINSLFNEMDNIQKEISNLKMQYK